MDEQINQRKKLKTVGSLNTKDQDKRKQTICLNLQKMWEKNNKQNKK